MMPVPMPIPNDRKRSPVFVMGCHRSGTNLLYDILLSSGGFAIYRGLIPIYNKLIPRFGSFERRANREKIVEIWLRSKGFRRAGIGPQQVLARIRDECTTGGDFICAVMDLVAKSQRMERWALYDPENVLHVERVKRDIPNALFLHIIRDGRDIALSLKRMGGFAPLPWDRSQTDSLVATALYWEWMVLKGCTGRKFPADYMEIHYEDLITNTRETLSKVGGFIDHDLDYSRIQRVALGCLSETNSSFRGERREQQVSPLARWKKRLAPADVAAIESTVGECLQENGYDLSLPAPELHCSLRHKWMRAMYPAFLDGKQWLKLRTPAGRFTDISFLELENKPVPLAESTRR
jgi:Sulfotransferase family